MATTLKLRSSRKGVSELWIEPWGDRIPLVCGEEYQIVATGDCPTLEFDDTSVTVWAEDGLSVLHAGSTIWPPRAAVDQAESTAAKA
jgi:hypothetical protein